MVSPVTNYDAGTGQMCFAAALVSMKAGSRARRSNWAPGHWVSVVGDRIVYRFPDGSREAWRRPMDDLLAEDWMEALVPYGTERP